MSEDLTWIRDGIEAPLKQRIAELEAEVEKLQYHLAAHFAFYGEVGKPRYDAAREVAQFRKRRRIGAVVTAEAIEANEALDRLVEVMGDD